MKLGMVYLPILSSFRLNIYISYEMWGCHENKVDLAILFVGKFWHWVIWA